MRSISQRELRNDNAEVVRHVEAGESFVVTKLGVPVAKLTPIAADEDLRRLRAAAPGHRWAHVQRVRSAEPTDDMLDDLRADR